LPRSSRDPPFPQTSYLVEDHQQHGKKDFQRHVAHVTIEVSDAQKYFGSFEKTEQAEDDADATVRVARTSLRPNRRAPPPRSAPMTSVSRGT
jgi:hypothetical protein